MIDRLSDVASFRRDPLSLLVERGTSAAAPLVPLNISIKPVYLMADPEYVKPLLKLPEEVVDKGPRVRKVIEVLGPTVLTFNGEEHRRRREAMHSFVARNAVESLTPVLAAETREAIAQVAKKGDLDARQFGANLALRLVSVVSFGSKVLSPEDRQVIIEAMPQALTDLADKMFRDTPQMPWSYLAQRRRIKQCRKNMLGVVRGVRERAPDSIAIRSFGKLGLSDQETADEILMLLLAGHDTTGAAAAWLFHAMATMPELADRIAAEAVAVRDDNGEIDVAKLASATTTMAAVREVLRLYPPGYWMGRGIRKDVEFGGRLLRRGTSVIISPWLFHRSSRFWEAPDAFRLDRTYTTKAYIPFGTGPRVCVGAALATLELQIIALEAASALHFSPNGLVGAPVTTVHLGPPAIPLKIRSRVARAGATGDSRTPNDHSSPRQAGRPPAACPFHS